MSDLSRIGRRGLLVTAVAGVAGATVLATGGPAFAAPPAVGPGARPRPGAVARNKAMVAAVYDRLFNHGDVSVVDRFFRPDYIQHNPQAPDGTAALKQLVSGVKQAFPRSVATIHRVLGEGDLVALHSHLVLTPGERGSAVVDIFRVTGGRIAEHWDVVQDVPATTVSGNDMFSTLSRPPLPCPDPAADPAVSRKLALGLFHGVFFARDVAAVRRFAAPTYLQHNPQFPNGSAVLEQAIPALAANPDFSVSPKRVVVDGDYVLVHSHYRFAPAPDRGLAVVDLWRVRDGKVVEHWDVGQPVPATAANSNTMF